MQTKTIERIIFLFFLFFAFSLNGQINIDYPAEVTVQCGVNLVPSSSNRILGYPKVTSTCSNKTFDISYEDNKSGLTGCGNTGVISRFWTAKDKCGGLKTLLQKITVRDTTAPKLTCVNKTIECDSSLSPIENSVLGFPTIVDCSPAEDLKVIFEDENKGEGFCLGMPEIVERTWTVTDECKNSASCKQIIRVGNDPMIILCEIKDLVQECNGESGSQFAAESWNLSNVNQLTNCTQTTCGPVSVISDFDYLNLSNECSITGSLEVNYLIRDNCGNTKFRAATFTLRDTTPPTSFCNPLDFQINCEGDETANTRVKTWHRDNFVVLSSCLFDNCGDPVITSDFDTLSFDINNLNFDCTDTVGLVVNYTITDGCGNFVIKKAALKVVDFVAPTFEEVAKDTTIKFNETVPVFTPIVLDNCSNNLETEFTENKVENTGDEGYTLVRTWTATDICGNEGKATQRVKVLDRVLSLACSSAKVEVKNSQIEISNLQAPNEIVKVFNDKNAIVYNCFRNCGEVQNTRTLTQGAYLVAIEFYTATWQLICKADISINVGTGGGGSTNPCTTTPCEKIIPVLNNVPADISVNCNAIPAVPTNITATDNCDTSVDLKMQENKTTGDCNSGYSITRTWTATDDCKNIAVKSQKITVRPSTTSNPCSTNPCETVKPVLNNVPANINVRCNSVPVVPTNITATDNCDNNVEVTFSETKTTVNCTSGYSITRTWVATDDCKNTNSGRQIITVLGNLAPVDTTKTNVKTACDSVVISKVGNTIRFSNFKTPNKIVKVFDANFNTVYDCDTLCNSELNFSPTVVGNYYGDVQLYTADWKFVCETRKPFEFTSVGGSQSDTTANGNKDECARVEIISTRKGIVFKNLNRQNKIIKVFNEKYILLFNCFANCEEEFLVELNHFGVYHTDIQFYDENWKFLCQSQKEVEISQTSPTNPCLFYNCEDVANANATCSDVKISTNSSQIIISGLNAPNEIVKVFNKNYDLLFECFGNCSETVAIANLTKGDYLVSVNFYDVNWGHKCEKVEWIGLQNNVINDKPNVAFSNNLSNISNEIELFPNPAKNEILISLKSDIEKSTKILIINQLGQLVFQKDLKEGNLNLVRLDISNLKTGVYFLRFENEKGVFVTKKLIKSEY